MENKEERKIVKQCPVMALNRDAEVHTDCIEARCAWWQGNQCTMLNIADCLNELCISYRHQR